jgi:outer membrane protease
LRTNNNPQDNYYSVKDQWGNVVLSRSNLTANKTYYDTLKLTKGCYSLELIDEANDGLDYWAYPGQGTGSFRLKKIGGLIFKTFNPDFGRSIKYAFAIQNIVGEIKDSPNELSFDIYPNPGTGKFNLDFSGLVGNYKIEIYNLTGSLLKSDILNLHEDDSRDIDLSGYEKGMYIIRVTNGTSNMIKKLVVN